MGGMTGHPPHLFLFFIFERNGRIYVLQKGIKVTDTKSKMPY